MINVARYMVCLFSIVIIKKYTKLVRFYVCFPNDPSDRCIERLQCECFLSRTVSRGKRCFLGHMMMVYSNFTSTLRIYLKLFQSIQFTLNILGVLSVVGMIIIRNKNHFIVFMQ